MKNIAIQDVSRIIEMAWEDCTPFEAIELQFGLKENDVRRIIRRELTVFGFGDTACAVQVVADF
ncbi:MAG: TIGR03643 family protein [Ignavibacteriales bacterium]|nr:TIGR03643 family protein [Ignavibacteriales bacterium]